jgi:hypothetical protein
MHFGGLIRPQVVNVLDARALCNAAMFEEGFQIRLHNRAAKGRSSFYLLYFRCRFHTFSDRLPHCLVTRKNLIWAWRHSNDYQLGTAIYIVERRPENLDASRIGCPRRGMNTQRIWATDLVPQIPLSELEQDIHVIHCPSQTCVMLNSRSGPCVYRKPHPVERESESRKLIG